MINRMPALILHMQFRSTEQKFFALFSLANKSAMEVAVIVLPLVYGPNAPGNFATLMNWLWSGFPLPFGTVTNNRRSFVCIDNLVSLIEICLDHPAAANQTFLVSDDEDLLTAALLRRLTTALGRPVRLIPAPVGLITLGAKMIGRPGIAQRLCGSLQVDIGKTKELLGWSPLVSVDEGLRRAAEHWLKSCGKRQRVSARSLFRQAKLDTRCLVLCSLFMKRVLDLTLDLCAAVFLAVRIFIAATLVRLKSSGPARYWSDRVGKGATDLVSDIEMGQCAIPVARVRTMKKTSFSQVEFERKKATDQTRVVSC